MENRNRISRWLSLLALTLLLTGCGQDVTVIGPGECLEVYASTAAYAELPGGKYMKLSQELCDTMARDARWTAPAGVTVEDAVIRAAPSSVKWELGDSRYSADGAVLKARAVLCAADQLRPQTAELRATLPMMARIGEELEEKRGGSLGAAEVDTLATNSLKLSALADDVPQVTVEDAAFVPPDTLILARLDLRGTAAEAKRARSRRRTVKLIGGSIALLICVGPVLNAIFPSLLKGLRGRKR